MNRALSSFLYVLSSFGLLALFPLLGILGFALFGVVGSCHEVHHHSDTRVVARRRP